MPTRLGQHIEQIKHYAEESNKRYKYLLANGTTGLSVAFDLPTQLGLGLQREVLVVVVDSAARVALVEADAVNREECSELAHVDAREYLR